MSLTIDKKQMLQKNNRNRNGSKLKIKIIRLILIPNPIETQTYQNKTQQKPLKPNDLDSVHVYSSFFI